MGPTGPIPGMGWPDEIVCDCVRAVSKHHHSPSGRVGLSGPERAIRFAKYHGINRKTAPPGRYRVRPPHGEVNGRSANIFISPPRDRLAMINRHLGTVHCYAAAESEPGPSNCRFDSRLKSLCSCCARLCTKRDQNRPRCEDRLLSVGA